jgi:hypothetical protein
MSTSTAVPTTITPEAAAHIAKLGIGPAVDQMLEHARQTIPDLKALEVVLEPTYDLGPPDEWLTIYADSGRDWVPEDKTAAEFGRWRVTTFPPEVCQHIALLVRYGHCHHQKDEG